MQANEAILLTEIEIFLLFPVLGVQCLQTLICTEKRGGSASSSAHLRSTTLYRTK